MPVKDSVKTRRKQKQDPKKILSKPVALKLFFVVFIIFKIFYSKHKFDYMEKKKVLILFEPLGVGGHEGRLQRAIAEGALALKYPDIEVKNIDYLGLFF